VPVKTIKKLSRGALIVLPAERILPLIRKDRDVQHGGQNQECRNTVIVLEDGPVLVLRLLACLGNAQAQLFHQLPPSSMPPKRELVHREGEAVL